MDTFPQAVEAGDTYGATLDQRKGNFTGNKTKQNNESTTDDSQRDHDKDWRGYWGWPAEEVKPKTELNTHHFPQEKSLTLAPSSPSLEKKLATKRLALKSSGSVQPGNCTSAHTFPTTKPFPDLGYWGCAYRFSSPGTGTGAGWLSAQALAPTSWIRILASLHIWL